MKTSIDIETRVYNGKDVDCYIPKINNIPVLGENGFIFKESISVIGKITDNLNLAESLLKIKVSEIEKFISENSKFI